MKHDTKSTKFVNYYYFLKEMIDDMASTLQNVEKVVEEQTDLIIYLEKGENKSFDALINQLKQANVQYNEQIKVLKHRIDCLNKVEELEENNKEYVVSMLLEAFGVLNKEAKTLEERETNNEEISKA